jgi:beta-glucosidase
MQLAIAVTANARAWSSRRASAMLGVALSAILAVGAQPGLAESAGPMNVADPGAWPAMASPIARDEELEARVSALLTTMTVEEKVGQIIQGDLGSVTPEDLREYRLGSVLAGGNSDPGGRYNATAAEWLALADAFFRESMDTSLGGKAIPVLLGIDAVHGHNNVVGATLFPHNIALGAAHDPALVGKIAAATAIELRATGFEWTFAPTVTVPRDDRWGRTYEGYSEDPSLVASYARSVVEGLQGKVGAADFLDASHVLASSKHFIGDGGTTGGKDKGNTEVTEAELRDVHGAGHIQALKAGTQTVMASFSSWNGAKMHGNHSLLTDVLKTRLGFDGFVVGDWNGHGEVRGCSNDSCPAALLAGLDMYMAPDTWKALYHNTLAQVQSGAIPMQRLDDAVTRILRVKFRLGLFEAGLPSTRQLGGHFEQLGSAEHRALAREAVRKSLVLLKNNGQLLPLNPKSRVLVAGDGADNIGKQAGGWTLSWQGTGVSAADFPGAESIWSGIHAAVAAAGGTAELSVTGKFQEKPDVAIVVFGEDPYAEFIGDIPNLAYQPGAERDLALLRSLKSAGIPVVAVFLSGRPLWVNREINAADAFVAAWLPGSEGGGIADLLMRSPDGASAYDFEGRLSFSWPRTALQTPLNQGQRDYDPQFALGYGLRYREPAEVALLGEESGLASMDAAPGRYFVSGKLASGWSLMIADGAADGAAVSTLPSGTLAQHISVVATDHAAQEDARRLQWSGAGAASIWLQSATPLDLSREGHAGAALVATIRVDRPAEGPVHLALGCGQGCSGAVSLDQTLTQLPTAVWTRVALPLSCFEHAGADLSKLSRLFELQSAAALGLSLSSLVLGGDSDQVLSCDAP